MTDDDAKTLPQLRALRESLIRRIAPGRPGVTILRARLLAVTARIIEAETAVMAVDL